MFGLTLHNRGFNNFDSDRIRQPWFLSSKAFHNISSLPSLQSPWSSVCLLTSPGHTIHAPWSCVTPSTPKTQNLLPMTASACTSSQLQNTSSVYAVRTAHFGMKLYNDHRNAQLLNLSIYLLLRHAVAQWLRHCATNQKIAGSIPNGVTGIFHWHNPSGRTMALGSTQPLTEMSTRSISWGKGGLCVGLTTLIIFKGTRAWGSFETSGIDYLSSYPKKESSQTDELCGIQP
jgi:hypothetical protein